MSSVATLFSKQLHIIPKGDPTLAIPDAKIGIEIEVEQALSFDNLSPLWSSKEDHSLREGGREFVTNGGLVGRSIKEALQWFCKYAVKNKYSIGYPRAGIHIHLDCTEVNAEDPTELARIMQTYMILEPAMFWFAGNNRRNCGFCEAFGDSQGDFAAISEVLFKWNSLAKSSQKVRQLFSAEGGRLSKYQAINLLPLSQFGTLEFRHLPTTFDYERIVDWINIILSCKAYAMSYKGDIITRALEVGHDNFFKEVLGDWYKVLAPFNNANEFHEAALNARLIEIHSKVKAFEVPKEVWPGKPSKLLEAKRKKLVSKSSKGAPAPIRRPEDPLRQADHLVDIFQAQLNRVNLVEDQRLRVTEQELRTLMPAERLPMGADPNYVYYINPRGRIAQRRLGSNIYYWSN